MPRRNNYGRKSRKRQEYDTAQLLKQLRKEIIRKNSLVSPTKENRN